MQDTHVSVNLGENIEVTGGVIETPASLSTPRY